MSGSLGSQIVTAEVESFFKGEKKRRGLIDSIKFLDAVRRVLSLSDSRLADCLGVGRTTRARAVASSPRDWGFFFLWNNSRHLNSIPSCFSQGQSIESRISWAFCETSL